ncbi:ParB/RepB/Spo0J family partition protein [Nocardia carnea]|uniref:ParB/RepB/Spo0J family partition protein n=1 Tax=Nocardia carnea TaxID=37328 RepID=UPI002457C61B|nr:ParB/RepB/Spo0J family partition protein [Nocardia carnea]
MSSTTLTVVTDPDDTTDEPQPVATETVAPQAEAAYLHPAEVVIADNVRKTFDLADHPDEVASIREFGVGLPIRAERGPDGTVYAIDGQLRVLIAREVGLDHIPVWIVDAPAGVDDKQRRIDRTLMQINLNDRRVPLSARDRAAGIAQMLDLGASLTRVAKGLQRNRAEIKKSAAVGRSETAKNLLGRRQYSLDQLAVIAEYENLGDTDAVERLSQAPSYDFTYLRNRIDADRAETRNRLHAALPYAAYGFGVLTAEPDTSGTAPDYIPAAMLATADDGEVDDETIFAGADRWVVYLTVEENALLVDRTTGEIVDRAGVDWTTRGEPDAAPADGLRHADTVAYTDRWTPHYYLPAHQLAGSGLHYATDPADTTRAAAEQTLAQRERARRERRMVLELNKRGRAAKDRRLDTLPRLVAKATPPTGAAVFLAQARAHSLGADALDLAATLLGLSGGRAGLLAAIEDASANRATTILLAMELAAHETDIDKTLWRHSTAATTRYLRYLDAIGHDYDFALVDVEQAAVGDIDHHTIDIAA